MSDCDKEKMLHIDQFPLEIIEKILTFLDGYSLCQASRVCQAWRDLALPILKEDKNWKKFCIKDIPRDVLEEHLSSKKIPLVYVDLKWKPIYKKWFQGKMIKSCSHRTKTIEVDMAPITSLKVSGAWIISTHTDGFMAIWNKDYGYLQHKMSIHYKTITDSALVDIIKQGTYMGFDKLPWDHHHLITISKDRYIRLTPLLHSLINSNNVFIRYHGDGLETLRMFGKRFAVLCHDDSISVWELNLRIGYFDLNASLVYEIRGPGPLFNIGFWHEEIQCIMYSGYWKTNTFDINKKEKEPWLDKEFIKDIQDNGEKISSVSSAHIFRNSALVLFTTDGKMVIIVNGEYRFYHLMPNLYTLIVSIKLCGTILALGGENGKLFLYHVPEIKDLLNLELSRPSFKTYLSEASIIYIDIVYENSSPLILAATNKNIYIINWYKPKLTNLIDLNLN